MNRANFKIDEQTARWTKQMTEAERRKRQRRAIEPMDRLARKLGDWPAEKLLRATRDEDVAPRRAQSMVRINITVDLDTLRLADRAARRRKTSRSDFIRSAVRTAATADDAAAQERELRERRHKAIQEIRKLAKEAGSWPAVKIVHDWRYRLVKANR